MLSNAIAVQGPHALRNMPTSSQKTCGTQNRVWARILCNGYIYFEFSSHVRTIVEVYSSWISVTAAVTTTTAIAGATEAAARRMWSYSLVSWSVSLSNFSSRTESTTWQRHQWIFSYSFYNHENAFLFHKDSLSLACEDLLASTCRLLLKENKQ